MCPAAEYILTAEGAATPFSVIAPLRELPDGTRLYKLFSRAPLAADELAALFGAAAARVAEHDWAAAYPVFGAPERFAPFQLAEARDPRRRRLHRRVFAWRWQRSVLVCPHVSHGCTSACERGHPPLAAFAAEAHMCSVCTTFRRAVTCMNVSSPMQVCMV